MVSKKTKTNVLFVVFGKMASVQVYSIVLLDCMRGIGLRFSICFIMNVWDIVSTIGRLFNFFHGLGIKQNVKFFLIAEQ